MIQIGRSAPAQGLHVASSQLEGHELAGGEQQRYHRRAGQLCAETRPVVDVGPDFRGFVDYVPSEPSEVGLHHFLLLGAHLRVAAGLFDELVPAYFLVEGVRPQQPVYLYM